LNQTNTRYAIQNGAVVLPDAVVEGGTVLIDDGRIHHAGAPRRTPRGFETVDARGGWVCPGLIEVHFHGAGRNSLDPPDEQRFRAIAYVLLSRGITLFLPTMMASEAMIEGMAALIDAADLARRIPGLYVEGPFVSPHKRGGIQEAYVRPIDLAYLDRLRALARGRLRMMTFAPELDGADALLPALIRRHILPCVGHTTATYERTARIVGRRTVNLTHLFNAMTGLDHRDPGVAAFGLNHDRVWVELNPDGTHVHPELLKLTYRAKPRDRIILVSDAVISAGEKPGDYEYMGRGVVADERGVYYRDQGTLVGSRLLLNQGMARFMKYTGARVHEAVRMASLNPATMLGLAARKGSLEPGKDADVVVFPRNFAKARAVFLEGERML